MSTTFEKTWQQVVNNPMDQTDTTHNAKNMMWWLVAFLTGRLGENTFASSAVQFNKRNTSVLRGMWSVYYMSDSSTAGAAGDGVDRWSTYGAALSSGNSISITTGAGDAQWVRITGLSGMSASDVGNFLQIAGAASAANNSPSNTPWKIVAFVSATSVDIYNPAAVTGDANNGTVGLTWSKFAPPTYTFANLVNAGAGSAHSWAVLKSISIGGSPWYIILDYSGAPYQISMWMSQAAPTGGSITNRPTSTDEVQAPNWNNRQIDRFTNTTWMHGLLATDGNFFLCSTEPGGNVGAFPFTWLFQVMPDRKAADTWAASMYMTHGGGGSGYRTDLQTVNNWASRKFDGSAQISLTVLRPTLGGPIGGDPIFESLLSASDGADSLFDDFPIYVVNSVVGAFTLKGRLADFKWAPAALPDGYTEPNPQTPSSTVVGDMWTPFAAEINL